MDSLVLVFVVVAALLVVASGIWVAAVLIAVISAPRARTEDRKDEG